MIIPRIDKLDEVSSSLNEIDIYDLVNNDKTIININERINKLENIGFNHNIIVNTDSFSLISGLVIKEEGYLKLKSLYKTYREATNRLARKEIWLKMGLMISSNKLYDIVPIKYEADDLFYNNEEYFMANNKRLNITGLVKLNSFFESMKENNYLVSHENYENYIYDLFINSKTNYMEEIQYLELKRGK